MKNRSLTLIALILVLVTLLSACGPSAEEVYAEQVTAPANNFSAKLTEFATVFSGGNMDDLEWQAKVNTALDELDQAAADLENAASGEVPENFKTFDGYLKEVTSETPNMTNAVREAFQNYNDGNVTGATKQLKDVLVIMEKISVSAEKMNAEAEALNQ